MWDIRAARYRLAAAWGALQAALRRAWHPANYPAARKRALALAAVVILVVMVLPPDGPRTALKNWLDPGGVPPRDIPACERGMGPLVPAANWASVPPGMGAGQRAPASFEVELYITIVVTSAYTAEQTSAQSYFACYGVEFTGHGPNVGGTGQVDGAVRDIENALHAEVYWQPTPGAAPWAVLLQSAQCALQGQQCPGPEDGLVYVNGTARLPAGLGRVQLQSLDVFDPEACDVGCGTLS